MKSSNKAAVNTGSTNMVATVLENDSFNLFFKSNLDQVRLSAVGIHLLEASPLKPAIYHAQLLIARLSPVTPITGLLSATKSLINALNGFNLLTHHFATHAASSLAAIAAHPDAKRADIQDEIGRVAAQFTEALSTNVFPMTSSTGYSWTNALIESVEKTKTTITQSNGATSGLRGLADAATERQAGDGATEPVDEQLDESTSAAAAAGAAAAASLAAQAQATAAAAEMQLQDSLTKHDPRSFLRTGYMNAFEQSS
jgi:hypothetical protein